VNTLHKGDDDDDDDNNVTIVPFKCESTEPK
jgi:hypothetical protein